MCYDALQTDSFAERWLSGRKQRFAKPSYGLKLYRGFESPPLRQTQFINQSAQGCSGTPPTTAVYRVVNPGIGGNQVACPRYRSHSAP
jgi:hypothetical protein